MGLMGLMGLMGCSGNSEELAAEPQLEQGTPISFAASESEEQGVTRAGTPLNTAGTEEFKVWGYKHMTVDDKDDSDPTNDEYTGSQTVFPGYQTKWISGSAATTTSNSDGWEYVNQQTSGDEQTIKYWDWGAKAYRFFAVTSFTSDAANEPHGPHEFTFAADATNIAASPYFSRLWFSTGNTIDYPEKAFGKPVQLSFLKPFAKVRFMFTYSYEPEGIRLKNKVFKPTDNSKIALKGTVTVSYPLEGTATIESYSVTPEANPTSAEVLEAFTEEYIPNGTEKWYTVLPRDTQGSYTLSVSVNGEPKTVVVPAEYMTWLPGYSYTYIFKITEEGGVEIADVQSAVTPWTEMEIENSVYNW